MRRVENLEQQAPPLAAPPDHVIARCDEIRAMRARLCEDLRASEEETRRLMRVLHGEVIEEFNKLIDAVKRRRRKPRRS